LRWPAAIMSPGLTKGTIRRPPDRDLGEADQPANAAISTAGAWRPFS